MKNQIYLGLLVLFYGNTFTSSSNIANTDFRQGNLAVTYTAGKSITLLPDFMVQAKQFSGSPVIDVRNTVFKVNVAGCSN